MDGADPNLMLRRAEEAFSAGRYDAARVELDMLRMAAGDQPAAFHLLALVERRAGNPDAARAAFEQALKLAPDDPQIRSNYGNLLAAVGDGAGAVGQYDLALRADPSLADARFNRATALQGLGRFGEALSDLETLAAERGDEPRVHSARGAILRALGRLGEAAAAFDRALALDPARKVALHGRARVALERGEEGVADRYARALAADPDNREVVLGLAQALELDGRAQEGVELLASAVGRTPGWMQGQMMLARMRWEAGEARAFTRDFEPVAEALANPAVWSALAQTYAGADLHAEAAEAAGQARALAPDEPMLALAEAGMASNAGDVERADTLFAALAAPLPGRALSEARHSLRAGRFDRAAQLLETARAEEPASIAAWALTSLAWRLTGDRRTAWLNDQPGLVRADELELDDKEIAAIAERLRSIHRTRAHPIGQSLRGGTQTRGRLFEREDSEIQLLGEKVRLAVARYWHDLPAPDEGHPLLRHRSTSPRIVGSWSVRLTDGGFHVAHFHSKGIVSSATYFAVPESPEPYAGWLEIGGAPAELDLPLEPLVRIEPAPGRLALFPSYMFHGTRPFAQGERLTAAFDVVPG